MIALLTGLAAGALHVVAGPDHLAALAPLAVKDRGQAARIGATWGLGHGLGVALVGGLGILAKQFINLDVDVHWLSAWSEFFVGFLLIGVGLWSLRVTARFTIHDHGHDHTRKQVHSHLHVHVGEVQHDTTAHARHTHAAFGVGMLHGAAGTGHLFGVLPALALPPAQAGVYLGAYLVSAVVTMAGFGGALGVVARRGGPRVVRGLMGTSGLLAIAVGGIWLFNSAPL